MISSFFGRTQKIQNGRYRGNITVNDSMIPVIITVDSLTQIEVYKTGPTKRMLSFYFNLSSAATVSAGLYKGDLLIRTLFNNRHYDAGYHYETAEPLTDNFDTIRTVDGLHIKVLSNNVKYEWRGVIGNTSDSMTGSSVHHNYGPIQGIAFAENYGYYATGYNERKQSFNKFNIATPNQRIVISNKKIAVSRVCTDGNKVYWGATDPYSSTVSLIFATNCSNDSEVIFPYGISYTTRSITSTFPSCINLRDTVLSTISAMTVSGNFLFVSRAALGIVDVLDKTTGAMVATHMIRANGIAVDSLGNLWATSGSDIKYYRVGSDGSIELWFSFSGGSGGALTSISISNNELVVTDRGTAQVRAYSFDGDLVWTLGGESYENDVNVYDDKFYWNDVRGSYSSFVAFQSDGTFWVGDYGNTRVQHFNSNREYINNIAYRPISYNTCTDISNPSRVFSDYCEYHVDYSRLLDNGQNGSWKLVKNWGYKVTSAQEDGLKDVTTLKGKTYSVGGDINVRVSGGRYATVISELSLTGMKRIDTIISIQRYGLYTDGSLRAASNTLVNGKRVWYIKKAISYTSRPVWDKETVFASVMDDALSPNFNLIRSAGEITSSDILIGYEGNDQRQFTYHLAGLKLGDSIYSWRTARGTFKGYSGGFPKDGSFDIGNGIVRTGDVKHHAIGKNIFYGQHGEFWKSSQINMWNHFYDNGLLVGQFGVLGPDVANMQAPAGMAGNAFMGSVVEVSGNLYLTHNDEGHHSGVHLWEISNTESVAVNSYNVELSDTPIDTNTIDLMDNWVRVPANDTIGWAVKKGTKTYDRFAIPDIYAFFKSSLVTSATLSKDIGLYNLNKWTIEGELNFDGNYPNRSLYGGQYFDILDDTGKLILRLLIMEDNNSTTSIYANNTLIANAPANNIKEVLGDFTHFRLSLQSGSLTFKLGDYPAKIITSTASVNKPKTVRFYFWNRSISRDRKVSFKDFKFIK